MKKLFALLLALVMAFSLVACGGGADAGNSDGDTEELIPLKISHHPYMHGLGSTYAAENGMYDIYDYTIDYYSGGPVQNEAIASGAWEVGTTGIAGAVLGITGYNLKVLGMLQNEATTTDCWCRSDSALASATRDADGILGTAEDWKGLDVLIATGTNTHLMLIALLEHLGLSESDVNIIDCSSVPNVYTAFLAGEGDVAFIWAPYGYTLESDPEYTKCADLADLGIFMPTLAICTEEAYKNRPEVVQQWLGIYYEACDGLMADPEAGAEMLLNYSEEQGIVMDEVSAAQEFEYRPLWSREDNLPYFEPDANGNCKIYEVMMTYAEFMLSQGKITQEQYDTMAESDFISDMILNIE